MSEIKWFTFSAGRTLVDRHSSRWRFFSEKFSARWPPNDLSNSSGHSLAFLFNQRTFFWLVARVVSLVFFRCSTFPLESVGLKVWNSNFRSQSIGESAMLASSLIRAPIALSSDWCYQFLKFGKRQPMSQRQWLFVSSPLAIRCYRFIRSLTNLLLSKIYWKVLVRIFWLPQTPLKALMKPLPVPKGSRFLSEEPRQKEVLWSPLKNLRKRLFPIETRRISVNIGRGQISRCLIGLLWWRLIKEFSLWNVMTCSKEHDDKLFRFGQFIFWVFKKAFKWSKDSLVKTLAKAL